MDSTNGLLTALGAVAVLGGLSWIAYVQAIFRGPAGRRMLVGVVVVASGAAALIAGAAIDTGTDDGVFREGARAQSTATPRPESTPTPTVEPIEAYHFDILDVSTRAADGFTRLFQLLQNPSGSDTIWMSELRQAAGEFARQRRRAASLDPPEGWEDTQTEMIEALDPLVAAARDLLSGFDADRAGNSDIAAELVEKAVADLAAAASHFREVGERLASRELETPEAADTLGTGGQ